MAPKKGKLTLKEFSETLGLSKSTVSRALGGYSDVSPKTRAKIETAAQELGYTPDPLARGLKRGRVESVGIVIVRGTPAPYDPFLSEFLGGVSRSLNARGRDLLVSTAGSTQEAVQVYRRLIEARKVDGFILSRTETHDPRIEFLRSAAVPFVSHGRSDTADDYAWFDIDNEAAFVEAVALAVQQGHRNIAHIAAPPHMNFARLRLKGFLRGIAASGIASTDAPVHTASNLDIESGEEIARRLLLLPEPPTAIICAVDLLAIGAYTAVKSLGLTVGRDVSILGYDGLPFGAYLEPQLTTFDQSGGDHGAQVADMLLDVIEGKDPATLQVIRQAKLLKRTSDGPPAQSTEELARKIACGNAA
ncbi:LacI family DNA-binding transcriptional regulator [Denitrobaculum tricleocarpae]|uniref:LacI family transcriptional regulator n=1 Tax=Denitrobaculum tricleocarpae TaxID=2591009 RepID=A0A545TFA8_9PROT|nr:substrate-binding domain-containing protein [Denitrobaculum tricleocarpae]TQV75875.1 LacI family transcriptional regulator [Denitrobaculum tricleocarpae]